MSVRRGILVRFLEDWNGGDEEFRTLLTVGLFLSDDDRISDIALSKLLNHESPILDEELVDRVLSVCSPLETAATLWGLLGFTLSPQTFQTLFLRVFESTGDAAVLHQLGGAANDYLRHHPDGFRVPEDLSSRLLQSENVDHRIIGLKLLKHTHLPFDVLVGLFTEALRGGCACEQCGALHEVEEILDGSGAGVINSLDRDVLGPFLRAIDTVAGESKDLDIGSACRRIVSMIRA